MRDREIDLIEVIRTVLKNWKTLAIICLLFGTGFSVFYGIKNNDETKVSEEILVLEKSNSNNELGASQANNHQLFINDLVSVLGSNTILNQIYDECNLYEEFNIEKEGITHNSLFNIETNTNSNVIKISCKLKSVELSKEVLKKVFEVFKKQAPNILEIKKIELINGPTIEEENVISNISKYGIIGMIVGALVYCGYVFVKHSCDGLIRTESEIKELLKAHVITYSKKTEVLNINEICDLLVNKKYEIVNFIGLNNEEKVENIMNEIVLGFKRINKKAIIRKQNEKYENDAVKPKDKKNTGYILMKSLCVNKSHNYVNDSKITNASIIIVEKEKDKYEDLEKLREDVELYNINVVSVVFVINN